MFESDVSRALKKFLGSTDEEVKISKLDYIMQVFGTGINKCIIPYNW